MKFTSSELQAVGLIRHIISGQPIHPTGPGWDEVVHDGGDCQFTTGKYLITFFNDGGSLDYTHSIQHGGTIVYHYGHERDPLDSFDEPDLVRLTSILKGARR